MRCIIFYILSICFFRKNFSECVEMNELSCEDLGLPDMEQVESSEYGGHDKSMRGSFMVSAVGGVCLLMFIEMMRMDMFWV